jgi:hypothetical protein
MVGESIRILNRLESVYLNKIRHIQNHERSNNLGIPYIQNEFNLKYEMKKETVLLSSSALNFLALS